MLTENRLNTENSHVYTLRDSKTNFAQKNPLKLELNLLITKRKGNVIVFTHKYTQSTVV